MTVTGFGSSDDPLMNWRELGRMIDIMEIIDIDDVLPRPGETTPLQVLDRIRRELPELLRDHDGPLDSARGPSDTVRENAGRGRRLPGEVELEVLLMRDPFDAAKSSTSDPAPSTPRSNPEVDLRPSPGSVPDGARGGR